MNSTTAVNLDQFMSDLKAVVRDGQELLRAGVTGMKETARQGVRTTDAKVRENPYRSLSIVFGLGVLVGVVAMSMLSSSDED